MAQLIELGFLTYGKILKRVQEEKVHSRFEKGKAELNDSLIQKST
jgi:hypothetical protein